MLRLTITLAVCVLLIGSGVIQGIWTNRFHNQDAAFREYADRVNRVPMIVGEWEGTPNTEKNTLSREQEGCSIVRDYVDRHGNRVSIFLTYGEKGPLCFNHTPLGCYRSNGYKVIGARTKFEVPEHDPKYPATFEVAQFERTDDPVPHYVRVYWSWSGSGAWLVPESPRVTFANFSGLYKLYVTRDMASPSDVPEADPAQSFMEVFLPELRKALFPDS
jgi:hypothetical protein